MRNWRCIDGKWRFKLKPVKPFNGTKPDKKWFDLGLAISGATLLPGQRRTLHDIGCFISAANEVMTGEVRAVSWQRIQQIEEKALRKLRHPERIKKLR